MKKKDWNGKILTALAGAAVLVLGMTGCGLRQSDVKKEAVLRQGDVKKEAVLRLTEETESTSGSAAAPEEKTSPEEETPPRLVCVYICGAVNQPGVYTLLAGSRGADALEAAGGFTEDAEQASANLAEYLEDGMMIVISEKNTASAGGQQGNGKINLNTADTAQLTTLPGIGESKAEEIIRYRERNGRFRRTEDLMKVPGIKEKAYERVKDRITV
ncbi:MAG: ComEA family DNA-binding protein [Stomatobaculum sp.]|nr:ComEA family DNA-binding protein [Stomatobaculum sp.]